MPQDPNLYAPPAQAGPQPAAAQALDVHPEYARFGVRLAARIGDFVVMIVFGFVAGTAGGILMAVLAAAGAAPRGWLHHLQKSSAGSFALALLAGLVYHTLSEGLGGASLGKLVLGLRVVREDLRPAGVGQALVRNLAYWVDALFLGLIAYFAMGKSRQQQRLGDRWGHTVVVRAASLPENLRGGVGRGLALGLVGLVVVLMTSVFARVL